MAVIYKITNTVNGNYYIGSAKFFNKRRNNHICTLNRNAHKNPRLQASWNKCGGDKFVFEILEEIPEDGDVLEYENKYLHRHVGKPECYNINTDAIGMRVGILHTAESKALMSVKVRAALAEGRAGKFIPTEETRKKMAAAAKGNQSAKGYKRPADECERIRKRMMGNQNWRGKKLS